ncbi:MAG: Ppx/GppA phosphatase family protein, partial [Desulfuromonadales bacterium]
MKKPRLAAIDIGTNSIRCIVVEAGGSGGFRVLDDEKATVRLGEGLTASGIISPAAWERAREALLRMHKITEGLGCRDIVAVATSAVRKAANGAAFVTAMQRDTGIAIRVIGGEEEAELAALSARHHFDMASTRYGLVDIGGGSIEVVITTGHHIEEIVSLELGAVFLTETFLPRDPIADKDFAKLNKHLRRTIKTAFAGIDTPLRCLIGSGGTITSIAGMIMAQRQEPYGTVHGYEVLRSEIVHLLAMLHRKNCKERRAVAGLSPERADLIVAGIAAVDALMRFFGTNLLRVNERGIREGLIIRSLSERGLWHDAGTQRDWLSTVKAFARSCHADEEHGEQVRKLSLALFAALSADPLLDERARQMLEAAALLHDVGYFISYDRHHKHSYHLIRHAELFGFSPRELEIVANLARYHRKALPKPRHENFSRLATADQVLVCKLGGILRLADGLDRRRSRAVETLTCTATTDCFIIDLHGNGDLSVETYGGQTKGDLFAAAFDCELLIRTAISHPA